jgi:hypothetical protein
MRAVEDLTNECGGVGFQPLANAFEALVHVAPEETCMDDEQPRQHEDEDTVEEHDEQGHVNPVIRMVDCRSACQRSVCESLDAEVVGADRAAFGRLGKRYRPFR